MDQSTQNSFRVQMNHNSSDEESLLPPNAGVKVSSVTCPCLLGRDLKGCVFTEPPNVPDVLFLSLEDGSGKRVSSFLQAEP